MPSRPRRALVEPAVAARSGPLDSERGARSAKAVPDLSRTGASRRFGNRGVQRKVSVTGDNVYCLTGVIIAACSSSLFLEKHTATAAKLSKEIAASGCLEVCVGLAVLDREVLKHLPLRAHHT